MSIRDQVRDKLSALTPLSHLSSLTNLTVEATGDRNAQMQYSNYEEGIVHRYGVKLVGWTFPLLVSPSELSTSLPALQTLYDALKHDTCKWEKLSPSQLTERIAKYNADISAGVIPARVRETRSDAGVKRPRAIRDESAPEDDADSGDEASTEVRVGPAPPKKRRVAKKAVVPALPDEDEDNEVREPHEVLPSTQPLRSRKRAANGRASTAGTRAPAGGAKKPAVAKSGTRKRAAAATKGPRDDATTRAALRRIKSRPTIDSEDEQEADPVADKENDASAAPSGLGDGEAAS
jgi:hypothetical protein